MKTIGELIMRILITTILLLISTSLFPQEITSGSNGKTDDPVLIKAERGAEQKQYIGNHEKISALRLVNYETTATGDVVLKKKDTKKADENSIEENFDRANNICVNGDCGSNLWLWGAVSAVAGLISVVLLKSK